MKEEKSFNIGISIGACIIIAGLVFCLTMAVTSEFKKANDICNERIDKLYKEIFELMKERK